MTGELLGFPVANCSGEYGDDERVRADSLCGGLSLDRRLQVGGHLQQLLRGLGHLRQYISWDILSATTNAARGIASTRRPYSREIAL